MCEIAFLFYLLHKCSVDVVFANIGTTELNIVKYIPDMYSVRTCLSEGVIASALDGYYRAHKKTAIGIYHTGVGMMNALSALHNAKHSNACMFNVIGDVETSRKYMSPLSTDMKKILECVDGEVLYMDCSITKEEIWKFVNKFHQNGGIYTVVISENFENKECETIAEQYNELLDIKEEIEKNEENKDVQLECVFHEFISHSRDKIAIYLSDYYSDIINNEVAYEISKRYDVYCPALPTRVWTGVNCVIKNKLPYFTSELINVFSNYEYVICFLRENEVINRPNFLNEGEDVVYDLYDKFTKIHAQKKEVLYFFARLFSYCKDQRITEKKLFKVNVTERFNLLNINNCIANMIEKNMIVVDESNSAGGSYYMFSHNSKKHLYMSANQGGTIGLGTSMAFGATSGNGKVVCLQSDGSMYYNMCALWSCVHYNANMTVIIYQNNKYGIVELERKRKADRKLINSNIDELLNIADPFVNWESIVRGFGANVYSVNSIQELKRALLSSFEHCGTDVVVIHLPER